MRNETTGVDDHERFRELGALANSGALSADERAELRDHLRICGECREVCEQYRLLVTEGVPMLAALYPHRVEHGSWDDTPAREKLFARVRASERQSPWEPLDKSPINFLPGFRWNILQLPAARTALVACLFLAVALGAYRLGGRTASGAKQAEASAEARYLKLMAERIATGQLLEAQSKKLAQLEEQSRREEQELARLRTASSALEDRAKELAAAKNTTEERASELASANITAQDQLRAVSLERDALTGQLRDAEREHLGVQAELANLRSQRDKTVEQSTLLQSRIDELSSANRDLARKVRDDEQYLVSDRDIRELMGARKLYIADVFDVDGHSRTRQPFGRVFYTHGKSLIFYAFDLDRQPGVKDASTFQAWGRSESSESKPVSLGILYMDNEANRRWALRCDDPAQLAQIDAVFVTVEPHGGSQKPSGKPFLYALLRKESNHP